MDQDKYIGRLLDNRYEIQEVIGSGGMAVVYKARCHRLNRLVAIKILKDELSEDEEFRRRFHAEGQAVAMVSHPNIVSVYDVSSVSDANYIVMELIDGITLKQYMEKKGVLNWKETLHFAIQIAKALEHAHSKGIVHRDIKPHNVMVLKNGSVKVADFGIARVMSKSNTLTKEALGSVHYISPEQAKGGRVDNRSDLYSLGVVMYEMITGRPPYDGESPVAVAIQHINGGANMPSTLNPNIPGGLEQIIMKAMSRDPDKRYTNATTMLYDMDEFRKNPTMLFDYNAPALDDVTRIHSTPLVMDVPKTTAERVVAGRTEPNPRRRTPPAGAPQRRTPPSGNPQRRTTASGAPQRRTAAGAAAGTARSTQTPTRRRQEEQANDRSQIATIAIVAGSAVALLALILLLWTLLNGGLFGAKEDLVEVPNLIGAVYEDLNLNAYDGINIDLLYRQFSDEFAPGQIMHQEPAGGVKVQRGNTVKIIVSSGPETPIKTMEKLAGLDLETAKNYLIGQGVLESNILPFSENSADVPEGQVIRTEPAEGEEFTSDSTVKVWVSSGPVIVKNQMPYVVGYPLQEAYDKLNEFGFTNVGIEPVESDTEKDEVISQSEKGGIAIDVNTYIILEVSMGPKKEIMPNVAGKTFEEAKKLLNEKGFMDVEPEYVTSTKLKDIVLEQSEAKDTEVEVLKTIVLKVSKGYAMPDVKGQNFETVQKTLTDLGYTKITPDYVDSDEPVGTILEQSISKDTQIDDTTEIVLTVSSGPKIVSVKKKLIIDISGLGLTQEYEFELREDDEPSSVMKYAADVTVVEINVEGYGEVTYQIYIDGISVKTVKVDFGDGQPTTEIKVS
jgi:serine/threonine-protein kinase